MPRSLLVAGVLAGMAFVLVPSAIAESGADHVAVTADELTWVDGPAALPPGARMALVAGDPRKAEPFTMRVKLPDGYKVPPHWHPADENVTVLKGTFLIGAGERWDLSKAKALPVGGYMMMPKGHRHFAATRGETLIQLHGVGPWQVNYLNPADDPRKKAPAKR